MAQQQKHSNHFITRHLKRERHSFLRLPCVARMPSLLHHILLCFLLCKKQDKISSTAQLCECSVPPVFCIVKVFWFRE